MYIQRVENRRHHRKSKTKPLATICMLNFLYIFYMDLHMFVPMLAISVLFYDWVVDSRHKEKFMCHVRGNFSSITLNLQMLRHGSRCAAFRRVTSRVELVISHIWSNYLQRVRPLGRFRFIFPWMIRLSTFLMLLRVT